MDIYQNARETAVYLQTLSDAKQHIDSSAYCRATISDPSELSVQLTQYRNMILAGEGLKAAFIGTLSDVPTVTVGELEARGVKPEEAAMIIAERDALRAQALELI